MGKRKDRKKKSAVRCRKEEQREAPGTNFDEHNMVKVGQVNELNSFQNSSIFYDIRSDWTAEQQLSAIRALAARACNEPSDDELDEDCDYVSHDESSFGDKQEGHFYELDIFVRR